MCFEEGNVVQSNLRFQNVIMGNANNSALLGMTIHGAQKNNT